MVVAAALALLCADRVLADCAPGLTTKIIPLPVYATLPNEGDTWGAMPVFLRVCPEGKRTESIIAPSVSWNPVIRTTGTFRWFHYPSDDTSLTVIGSVSTRINYNALLVWQKLPTRPGLFTDELTLRLGNHTFRCLHHPGHTPPQTSVYVPEEGVVFTGDNVFCRVKTFIQEADPWEWLESLKKIDALDVQVIVPGHGEAFVPDDSTSR